MALSIQKLNEKISRIQEQHIRDFIKLSSKYEKVHLCHEESIKQILLKLESQNIGSVNVSNFEFCKLVNIL